MNPSFILLSGPMAAGKSTLARALNEYLNVTYVNTREALNQTLNQASNKAQTQTPSKDRDRKHLQDAGQKLDRSTAGKWILNLLETKIAQNPKSQAFVIDCVRSPLQLRPIKNKYGSHATLVYLTSTPQTLSTRYTARGEKLPYSQATKHSSESKIQNLREMADLVIDTTNTSADQATHIVAAHMLGIPDCIA